MRTRSSSKRKPRASSPPPAPARPPKRSRSAAASPSSSSSSSSSSSVVRVVKKGAAPVDVHCPVASSAHVYSTGADVYDVMLNQTVLTGGRNSNKFYLLQLLQSDTNSSDFFVYFRWGRVGRAGRTALAGPVDVDTAMHKFTTKFYDKTLNEWSERRQFEKVHGKYQMLERDYGGLDEELDGAGGAGDGAQVDDDVQCELSDAVRDVVSRICDWQMLRRAMVELQYDSSRLPLGKLSKQHVQRGYVLLQAVADVLDGSGKRRELGALSEQFYTLIPHDFGMRRPPVIDSQEMLQEKLDMIEQLSEMQLAVRLLRRGVDRRVHPLDQQYLGLNCGLQQVGADNPDLKLVQQYVANTHAPTHNNYKLHLLDVLAIERAGEHEAYAPHASGDGRMWLWHGSRLANFVGILSQGLRIAPPEAPVTGYMFGKGVYFADMVSKSANYCRADRDNDVGLVLLCEVALGQRREVFAADSDAADLPEGFHSIMGMGRTRPDPKGERSASNGAIVPTGRPVPSGLGEDDTTLLYNEFVVYDTARVRMQYLVKVRFDFEVGEDWDF